MQLPDNAVDLIKKQRSNYKKKSIKHIKKMYNQEIDHEFNNILLHLDFVDVDKIIDIGCGLAGVSLQLSYYFNHPELYLVDKDEMPAKIKYGFHSNKCFYNSFDVLNEIIKMNYVENAYIISPEQCKDIKDVDLIISLLACGFHFPISWYIKVIYENLKIGGVFICDIRKTHYQQEIKDLELFFNNITEIKTDNPKTIRICAKEKRWLE